MRDFFDPSAEEQVVVLVERPTIYNLLDRITGADPSVTDYILEQPAKCPKCRHDILEKTLIEPE